MQVHSTFLTSQIWENRIVPINSVKLKQPRSGIYLFSWKSCVESLHSSIYIPAVSLGMLCLSHSPCIFCISVGPVLCLSNSNTSETGKLPTHIYTLKSPPKCLQAFTARNTNLFQTNTDLFQPKVYSLSSNTAIQILKLLWEPHVSRVPLEEKNRWVL